MELRVFSAILFCIPLLPGALPAQDEWNFRHDLEDMVCKESFNAGHHIPPQIRSTPFSEFTDIHYQVMRWEIDPAVYYIRGEVTCYYTSRVSSLSTLILDLSRELTVNAVHRNGHSLMFSQTAEDWLLIDLERPVASGEHDTITVVYEGIPPSNGFGSFEQALHGDEPVIWTLSEPYGQRDWWPGKQDLLDKIDSVDIYITTPAGLLAASNGKLMGITEANDGRHIHHWRHRYPVASYLIALAVTNYTAFRHFLPLANGDTLEILNYVYPESAAQAEELTQMTLNLIPLFSDLFGPYPFAAEKYGHAQFSWGGGMEHQTMSFMGNFSVDLQAHELAHQWFGNKVTCGSWQEIWLNEGFATYMTGLMYEALSPDLYWGLWKRSVSNSATSQPGGSVFVEDTTDVARIFSSRLTYSKGAYLLHMLRWIMGDDAFFNACRDYLDQPGTAYGFGSTAVLQSHLEARSGMDLDEFFTDWYYGEGYPSYTLVWDRQEDSLVFRLSQQPSHPSVSFFEMPVPVHVTLDGEDTAFILPHTSNNQRFGFFIGDALIDTIAFDPDRRLLSRDNVIKEMTTAVNTPASGTSFIIYPNPVRPGEDIMIHDEMHRISRIVLNDVFGTHVPYTVSSPGGASLFRLRVDSPGVYIMTVFDDRDRVYTYRVVALL